MDIAVEQAHYTMICVLCDVGLDSGVDSGVNSGVDSGVDSSYVNKNKLHMLRHLWMFSPTTSGFQKVREPQPLRIVNAHTAVCVQMNAGCIGVYG